MRINQRQIKRRNIQIPIRNRHKHRLIHRRITLIHLIRRLPRPALIRTCDIERRVGRVELRDPGEELGRAGGGGRRVAVVGADGEAGGVPCEEDLAAGEGEGFAAVARDRGRAVVACCCVVHAGLGVGKVGDAGVGDAGADDFVGGGVVGGDSGDLLGFGSS